MKNIYFVRHGECELNALQVFAGRSDSPLTVLGRQQAALAAADISRQGLKIDKIVSSPLWRATETARIIANATGYTDSNILVSPLFMERGFGMLEGTPRNEFFDAYSYEDIDNAPRAETLHELHERAKMAYQLLNSLPETTILVVSHSAFFRAFAKAIDGDPFNREYTSPFQTIKNGKVYSLSD